MLQRLCQYNPCTREEADSDEEHREIIDVNFHLSLGGHCSGVSKGGDALAFFKGAGCDWKTGSCSITVCSPKEFTAALRKGR